MAGGNTYLRDANAKADLVEGHHHRSHSPRTDKLLADISLPVPEFGTVVRGPDTGSAVIGMATG